MKFKIKNSNLFLLPGNPHMLHLATISYSLREFIVMLCISGEKSGNCYIEEVVLNTVDWTFDVFANLKFIDDDNLARDLAGFVQEKEIIDMKKITNTLTDQRKLQWLVDGNG